MGSWRRFEQSSAVWCFRALTSCPQKSAEYGKVRGRGGGEADDVASQDSTMPAGQGESARHSEGSSRAKESINKLKSKFGLVERVREDDDLRETVRRQTRADGDILLKPKSGVSASLSSQCLCTPSLWFEYVSPQLGWSLSMSLP